MNKLAGHFWRSKEELRSLGSLHTDELVMDDQLELFYNSSVRIEDVVEKTCQKQWTIVMSGERKSGKSVFAERHDDNNDDDICYVIGRVHYIEMNYSEKLTGFTACQPMLCYSLPKLASVFCKQIYGFRVMLYDISPLFLVPGFNRATFGWRKYNI